MHSLVRLCRLVASVYHSRPVTGASGPVTGSFCTGWACHECQVRDRAPLMSHRSTKSVSRAATILSKPQICGGRLNATTDRECAIARRWHELRRRDLNMANHISSEMVQRSSAGRRAHVGSVTICSSFPCPASASELVRLVLRLALLWLPSNSKPSVRSTRLL